MQYLESKNWGNLAAKLIESKIVELQKFKRVCNIIMTGGRSSGLVYEGLFNLQFLSKANLKIYFADERCVERDSPLSNYHCVTNTLFRNSKPSNIEINRIHSYRLNIEHEIKRYVSIMPNRFDIGIFGVGDDGHIASIQPGSHYFNEVDSDMVLVKTKYIPENRITITPTFLQRIDCAYVFGYGKLKTKILEDVENDKTASNLYPVCLLKGHKFIGTNFD
jgi:6-phosphogluconolactonase